ncbi:hypothetical protein Syun_019507 [Stephania yunnanensis]|uniref:Uncharacterized protein n=1 Tax=Stephania yunnanensis TaxID=152371 RepID=A0AAP0IVF7_9MAGN
MSSLPRSLSKVLSFKSSESGSGSSSSSSPPESFSQLGKLQISTEKPSSSTTPPSASTSKDKGPAIMTLFPASAQVSATSHAESESLLQPIASSLSKVLSFKSSESGSGSSSSSSPPESFSQLGKLQISTEKPSSSTTPPSASTSKDKGPAIMTLSPASAQISATSHAESESPPADPNKDKAMVSRIEESSRMEESFLRRSTKILSSLKKRSEMTATVTH